MPFETTHWSMVNAARGADSRKARRALEVLCTKYWGPLFYFAQQRGLSAETAQDMTQEFFTRLLEKQALNRLDRAKGKFRTFLLTSFSNMLNNEWDRQNAQKRNPGKPLLPLSALKNNAPDKVPAAGSTDPELSFDREWAMTILRESLKSLRIRYGTEGKLALLEKLEPYLTMGGGSQSYAELAKELGLTANAIKVAVHRLRRRYKEEIRGHVAETVCSQNEVDEELRYLLDVLTNDVRVSP